MTLTKFDEIVKYIFIFLVIIQVFLGIKKGKKRMAASDKFVNRIFIPIYISIGIAEMILLYRI